MMPRLLTFVLLVLSLVLTGCQGSEVSTFAGFTFGGGGNTFSADPATFQTQEKTGRLVIVDPAHQSCSVASEISSIVSQEGFWSLQAPIQRVTSLDCHFPFSPALEHLVFPNEDKIADAIQTTLE